MKTTRLFFAVALAASALSAGAQTTGDDPIVMIVNGQPVTRSEFEYSYNKNGNVEGAVEEKSVEEYAEMYANYKLKVIEAEAQRMDTAKAYREEFLTYRDMQLTPYMVDETFIDSVARDLYGRYEQQLDGKELIRPAHILILLSQRADEAEQKEAKAKADSIYEALLAGADFAVMASEHSKDPGSAERGGALPWIGPGATLKEFEDAAYALQPGELSKPVLSKVGYHIIKMLERKHLESFEELRPQIVSSLKQQNIEEASAEYRIQKIVDASAGRLTRETVLDSVLAAHMDNPELRYLVQEYHDGLLLYEISKTQVWDPSKADTKGLEEYFLHNRPRYAWSEPHFKGFVLQAKTKKALKNAKKILRDAADEDWKNMVKEQINKDSVMVMVTGPYLVHKGENKYIDRFAFKEKKELTPNTRFPYTDVTGRKLKQPRSYLDAKSEVENDYQQENERKWVESLRAKYPVRMFPEALKTVNKH